MCSNIENLTCYIGEYNQLLQLLAAALSLGVLLGAMVGIIAYLLKPRI